VGKLATNVFWLMISMTNNSSKRKDHFLVSTMVKTSQSGLSYLTSARAQRESHWMGHAALEKEGNRSESMILEFNIGKHPICPLQKICWLGKGARKTRNLNS